MFVVRPVQLADLDRLLELTEITSFGLTTLPKDRALLQKRIQASLRAFGQLDDTEPSGQAYLFVLEDLDTAVVSGTCGVVAKVGGFEPFYSYQIEISRHESPMLNVHKQIPVLHLVEDHDGPCEIGSLFLHPKVRGGGLGRLLSLSRFLFLAEYPAVFDPEVIAEMRGVIDEQGRSPFWDALGRHFFDIEFPKADYLSVVNKEFIGDLMPRFPIYIPLLPEAAQAVIGQVHELTRPARRLLELQGFAFRDHVDIFEGGPMLHCARDQIRTVRESRSCVLMDTKSLPEDSERMLVSSRADGFRATQGRVQLEGDGILLEPKVATALQLRSGDAVRCVGVSTGPRKE